MQKRIGDTSSEVKDYSDEYATELMAKHNNALKTLTQKTRDQLNREYKKLMDVHEVDSAEFYGNLCIPCELTRWQHGMSVKDIRRLFKNKQ